MPNTFEIIVVVIVGVIILGPILFLLIIFSKDKVDDFNGGDSGKIGWVIAIVIGIILFVALWEVFSDTGIPFEPRHTDNI